MLYLYYYYIISILLCAVSSHQVRIFFTSRCQIHAPAFPSKTSFQHFITSATAYISHEPKIASLLREVARAQRVTEGVKARQARPTSITSARQTYHSLRCKEYHAQQRCAYHACVSIHITNA